MFDKQDFGELYQGWVEIKLAVEVWLVGFEARESRDSVIFPSGIWTSAIGITDTKSTGAELEELLGISMILSQNYKQIVW